MTGLRNRYNLGNFDDKADRLRKFVAEFIAEHGRWPHNAEVLREGLPGLRSATEVCMMMNYIKSVGLEEPAGEGMAKDAG